MTSVLILGGYGTFGGNLARLLTDEKRLTLIIAGRSRIKAAAFCAEMPPGAVRTPVAFDRDGDVEQQLSAVRPDIVVDASGPFQGYGDDPFRVVKAALALGIPYLDLADGSDFVTSIAQFDADARARGIFILSGVSTLPALTAAAVRSLSHGMARIDAVAGGIALSPYAGIGLNVIKAIASYAGRPVPLVRDGRKAFGRALIETRRYTIGPPGRLPLKSTRFSLVDTPDLHVLPTLWPGLRSVWMGVGPVPEILHRMLNAFAWLVRLRLLPSLSPFATLMHRVINVLRWGEHRSGMFVCVRGRAPDGRSIERSWHLLAEGDDGPLVPATAATAIIRRCLDGRPPAAGARHAATDLELADYEALFASRSIHGGQRETMPADAPVPLYRRLLGDAWAALPEPLKVMHDVRSDKTAAGIATVVRGNSLSAWLLAALFGFPREGRDVPVTVTFSVRNGRETWTRRFAQRAFASIQYEGEGRSDRLLCERFGPFTFAFALLIDGERLRLVLRRWSFLGLALPAMLAPRGETYEFVENGRFNFHVEIAHPLTGAIVHYRGWLVPRA